MYIKTHKNIVTFLIIILSIVVIFVIDNDESIINDKNSISNDEIYDRVHWYSIGKRVENREDVYVIVDHNSYLSISAIYEINSNKIHNKYNVKYIPVASECGTKNKGRYIKTFIRMYCEWSINSKATINHNINIMNDKYSKECFKIVRNQMLLERNTQILLGEGIEKQPSIIINNKVYSGMKWIRKMGLSK